MIRNSIIVSLFFLAIPHLGWAQGVNEEASFQLDFVTNELDSQSASVIDATPVIDENNQFTATLVLKNATNLIGVNTDLEFNNQVVQVVSIQEIRGDLNFDGRANVADALALGQRLNENAGEDGLAFFNRDAEGDSADLIDSADIQAILPYLGQSTLFWTQNPNENADEPIRESVEIFQDPVDSNTNGVIDDIVVVLLPRVHSDTGFPEGFGFNGDARIAEMTFEIIDESAVNTEMSFSDMLVIDESTEVTTSEIINASVPQAETVTIPLQPE